MGGTYALPESEWGTNKRLFPISAATADSIGAVAAPARVTTVKVVPAFPRETL